MDDERPDLGDAALAVAAVGYQIARIPLGVAVRLPGMRRLALDGAIVRARLRSRLAGVIEDVLASPEVARTIDRVLAGALPDAVVRSLLAHRLPERVAGELAASVDLDVAVTAVLDRDSTHQLVQAVLASPGFDRLLVQATDRALTGPEMQRIVQHVAGSPEVREALTRQSTSLAEEMVASVRTRAESLDDAAERTVRGWLRRPRPA
jgi:hypothetical protein